MEPGRAKLDWTFEVEAEELGVEVGGVVEAIADPVVNWARNPRARKAPPSLPLAMRSVEFNNLHTWPPLVEPKTPEGVAI
jgi:hypothetical protein